MYSVSGAQSLHDAFRFRTTKKSQYWWSTTHKNHIEMSSHELCAHNIGFFKTIIVATSAVYLVWQPTSGALPVSDFFFAGEISTVQYSSYG